MAEEKRRSIKLMYGGKYHIGTLYEPDASGKFIYHSNPQGEKYVRETYFLPKSYDEMAGSNHKPAKEFSYISGIVAKLNRPDLIRTLGIRPNSNAFDILYKLAEHSDGNSVGDNIGFCVDEKETQNEC